MKPYVINRFRRRSDAEEYLRLLRRTSPDNDYTLLYYPPGETFKPMVRKEYNKLVRDCVPELLQKQKVEHEIVEMDQDEYCQALRQKIIEEAQEAAGASEVDLITELADLWEVIDATMTAYGIQRDQVLACQMQRRMERGAFNRKLKLLWTKA
jgi:predicted house-cleaning noncanonical NTP pyrophosphatase (MazG superfamily)